MGPNDPKVVVEQLRRIEFGKQVANPSGWVGDAASMIESLQSKLEQTQKTLSMSEDAVGECLEEIGKLESRLSTYQKAVQKIEDLTLSLSPEYDCYPITQEVWRLANAALKDVAVEIQKS